MISIPPRAEWEGADLAIVDDVYAALAQQQWLTAMLLVQGAWEEIARNDMTVVRAVAAALPPHVLAEHPRWAAIHQMPLIAVTARAAGSPAPLAVAVSAPPPELVVLTLRSRNARLAGHYREAADLARRAHSLFEATESDSQSAVREQLPQLMLQWGLSSFHALRERDASDLFALAFAWGVAASDHHVAAVAAGHIALQHAVAGSGMEADAWIARAFAFERDARHDSKRLAPAWCAQVLRHNDRLEHDKALEARSRCDSSMLGELATFGAGVRAVARARADGFDVRRVLDQLAAVAERNEQLRAEPNANAAMETSVRAQLLMMLGQPLKALPILDELIAQRSTPWARARRAAVHLMLGDLDRAEMDASTMFDTMTRAPRFAVETLTVRAVVNHRRGRIEAASRLFSDAVALADLHEIPVALAIVSAADFEPLAALAGSCVLDSTSLTALRRDRAARPIASPSLAAPTSREQQVLRVLDAAGHRSLAAIAAANDMSENTLKTHLRALYRKAGVRNRAGLLLAARRMGWL